MKQLTELLKHVETTSTTRVVEHASSSIERQSFLTRRIKELQDESRLLDSEQKRMELVIHVAEMNNRQCEFWKESLEQINSNYNKAIDAQSEKLSQFGKHIREIEELKKNYSSLHNESHIAQERYLDSVLDFKKTEEQVSEAFFYFDDAVNEKSKAVYNELEKIGEDSLEESFLRENEEKWQEHEKQRELDQLNMLHTKAEYAHKLLGIYPLDNNSTQKIIQIKDELNSYKDAKESLSDLQIYRDSLKAKHKNIINRRELLQVKLKGIEVEKATEAEIEKATGQLAFQDKDRHRKGMLD